MRTGTYRSPEKDETPIGAKSDEGFKGGGSDRGDHTMRQNEKPILHLAGC